ncbi:MAG: mechanosensitive ion channel family protein [Planctomycetota bacterium]
MNVWQTLRDVLSNPWVQGTIGSVLAVAAVVVIYLKLARRVIAPDAAADHVTTNRRLLRVSLLFLLLVVLVTIWATAFTDAPLGAQPGLVSRLLWTFGIAMAIYIAIGAIQHRLSRDITGIEARHKIRLTTSWAGIGIFVVATAVIWAAGVRDLGLFLGIIGAGLALSLQETLLCVAGWLLFIVRRPYDIGDRIEIDNRIGDVIGVSVFQTTMLEVGKWVEADQSTGRMLIIPNSMIIRHAIYNYAKGFPFIWDELRVTITFESDWRQAERLMLEEAEVEADKIAPQVKRQIRRMQRHYAIHYEHLTPTVYTAIADNGVTLTLRYLCPVRQRRAVTHRLSRTILQTFLSHDAIDFAYPTTRFYRNPEEGKPGTGGPGVDGDRRA